MMDDVDRANAEAGPKRQRDLKKAKLQWEGALKKAESQRQRDLKKTELQRQRDFKKAERQAKASERRVQAEADRAKMQEAERIQAEETQRSFGDRIDKIRFGDKELLFYSKGYLQVVGWSYSVPFEKILHVTVQHTVINKSPGGRKAAAVGLMTMGLPPVNLLASNERMDWTVTLRTSVKTHQFKATGRREGDLALKIEAIAKSLIQTAPPDSMQPDSVGVSSVSGGTIFDQIAKLKELFDAGILNDEEFASKKAQLLQRL